LSFAELHIQAVGRFSLIEKHNFGGCDKEFVKTKIKFTHKKKEAI